MKEVKIKSKRGRPKNLSKPPVRNTRAVVVSLPKDVIDYVISKDVLRQSFQRGILSVIVASGYQPPGQKNACEEKAIS